MESRQGFELWRSVRRVVCLSVNVRAPGVLSRMLSEMRDGHISDEMWSLYLSRVLVPEDARLRDPSSPFCQHPLTFIVHRHSIRAMRSMENAREESRQLQVPLYLVQAHDEAVRQEDRASLTPLLRAELLRRVNPDNTKALPSFLPLYIGMRVILASKDCTRIGIMKGCPCVIRDIVMAGQEILPDQHVCGDMHTLEIPASEFTSLR